MYEFPGSLLKEGRRRERRERALTILGAALASVDPVVAVRRYLSLEGDCLYVSGRAYDLSRFRHIYAVGAGKASGAMAQALEEILGERLTSGLVNVKYGYLAPTQRVRLQEAGHPLPDEEGLSATGKIVDLLCETDEDDLVICLISGGGSALLTSPQEGISLEEVKGLTEALLRCGATINEINAVRKHISQVKGGRLARLTYPASLITLILSDVVGDPLDMIASGPTVPDSTTYAEAWQVLERYELLEEIPPTIVRHLELGKAGQIEETPKVGDAVFERTYNLIIGNNRQAALAAVEKAQELGFNALLLTTYLEGEAREVAKVLAALAKEVVQYGEPVSSPACLVLGGETTVTVKGDGLGGRNQEMALAAALAIEGMKDVLILCAATDGSDGPTDAAGAIAEGDTAARARELGLDARAYLANNDSYHFFQALGDLIITGPTNTNVNDLAMVFVF
ncbi:MAG: glycerate kinase [Anaerolineae bacterium]